MATLTIRNVPDELYEKLKREAVRNRRSLNQQVITRLSVDGDPAKSEEEIMARVRRMRARLDSRVVFDIDDVIELKNAGRL